MPRPILEAIRFFNGGQRKVEEARKISIPLGIVLRRSPGVTRWARWAWKAVAVLPGAGPAEWRELQRQGDVVEYHAATVPLELYRTDTEAYRTELATRTPSIYVVMRETPVTDDSPAGLEVVLATASPFDGQDYADNGEDIVELVPMPPALIAWVQGWVDRHHHDEPFVKRRRRAHFVEQAPAGVGDARVRQGSDVYRAPADRRRAAR